MPGLGPGIHVFIAVEHKKAVDGPGKPGHDGDWAHAAAPSGRRGGGEHDLLNSPCLEVGRRGAASNNIIKGERPMRRRLPWLLASGIALATSAAANAHHSAAMFDAENPVELVGTVREFKYTSPHTFIVLAVKEPSGAA